MPLKSGRSKKVVSENIGELMHSFSMKGSIGTSHPEDPEKARKQAAAIAYRKAGLARVGK